MNIKEILSAAAEDRYTRKRLIWSGVTLGLTVVVALVGQIGQKQGWWEMEQTGHSIRLTPVQQTEQVSDDFDPTIFSVNETTEAPAEAPETVAKKCPSCGAIAAPEAAACPNCGNAGAFVPQVKCPVCGRLHDLDDPQCPFCEGKGE